MIGMHAVAILYVNMLMWGFLTTTIFYIAIQPVLTCFIFDLPTHWDKMINTATHVKLEIVMLHSSSLVAS